LEIIAVAFVSDDDLAMQALVRAYLQQRRRSFSRQIDLCLVRMRDCLMVSFDTRWSYLEVSGNEWMIGGRVESLNILQRGISDVDIFFNNRVCTHLAFFSYCGCRVCFATDLGCCMHSVCGGTSRGSTQFEQANIQRQQQQGQRQQDASVEM